MSSNEPFTFFDEMRADVENSEEFQELRKAAEDYLLSSEELLAAAGLVDGDEIKIEMVTFIAPEFEKMRARDEGLRAIVNREGVRKHRPWVINELKEIAMMSRSISRRVREKLEGLDGKGASQAS